MCASTRPQQRAQVPSAALTNVAVRGVAGAPCTGAAREACGICSIGCQGPNVCPDRTSGATNAAVSFAALAAASLLL